MNSSSQIDPRALAARYPRVEFLTPVQSIDFPTEWYEANSEDHFWFQWRARAADALIRRAGLQTDRPLKVFDIGCGTGITSRQMQRTTSWTFEGGDLNLEALARCDSGLSRVMYYDILEKRPELRERYDVVILFDVIEHLEDTQPFLEAAFFHLRPGGHILVNVPALMSLYSPYDVAAGHFRRYTAQTLAREFVAFPATVVDVKYWGFTMVPLLWMRKQVLRGKQDEAQTIRTGFVPPSPAAHRVLKAVMAAETTVLDRPPLGSSVMAAVRKS